MMWLAQPAIVGDVRAGHQKIVAADRRDAVFFFGGPVDRDRFADHVVIADDHLRVAAAVAHILRIAADHDAGKEMIVLAERHVAHQRHVVFQLRAAADAHLRADHAERPDLDVVVDFGRGINRGELSAMRAAIDMSTLCVAVSSCETNDECKYDG